MNRSFHSWRLAALVASTALAISACGGDKAAQAQQKSAEAVKPTVGVITVQPENVLLENNLPGRLEAVRSAPIVPQVSGIVKRRLFKEGSYVKAGQPLYQLEDASYMASLASARASLLSAQAQAAKATADMARYRPLVEADAISQQEWDAAVAAKRAADAAVQSSEAAIRSAQVNINHARITAPISGFIGESKVTEGALVSAGTTQMALIQQTDPMYVNITMSANDMMKLRQQLVSKERVLNPSIEVGIVLEDGTEYPYKGRMLFVDPTVDETTGQITVRVEVPNPDLILMSGLYVRVKLPLAGVLNAFVVPQQAVTRGTPDVVMVVTPEGKIEPRPVKITGQKGSNWVVTEGLNAGDKVIVEGLMIAGMTGAETVQTKEWTPSVADKASASQPATHIEAASVASQAESASSPIDAASSASVTH